MNQVNKEQDPSSVGVESPRSAQAINEVDHNKLPRYERLYRACHFASRNFGNELLKTDLAEAATFFADLRDERDTEVVEGLVWKQMNERTFAVQSETLQMTPAGLRIAMYTIPRRLRKEFLKFRWTRRYRDGVGKVWLEFEAAA